MAPAKGDLRGIYVGKGGFLLDPPSGCVEPSAQPTSAIEPSTPLLQTTYPLTADGERIHPPDDYIPSPTAMSSLRPAPLRIQSRNRLVGRRARGPAKATPDSSSDTAPTPVAPPEDDDAQAIAIDSPPPAYTPPIPLHAAITAPVAGSVAASPPSHQHHGLSNTQLAILTAVIFGVLFIVASAAIAWSMRKHTRKFIKVPRWMRFWSVRRRVKSEIDWKLVFAGKEGGKDVYDDKTWATPTLHKDESWGTTESTSTIEDLANACRTSQSYGDTISFGDFWLAGGSKRQSAAAAYEQHSRQNDIEVRMEAARSMSMPLPTGSAHQPKIEAARKTMSAMLEPIAEENCRYEADNLGFTLGKNPFASSTLTTRSSRSSQLSCPEQEYLEDDAHVLTALALQAGVESLGERESRFSTTIGRPRQGSNATDATVVDLEPFDDNQSMGSSATSLASLGSDANFEESPSAEELRSETEEAEVFQATRVQASSPDMKRGVLLSMGVPTVLVSSPSLSAGLDVPSSPVRNPEPESESESDVTDIQATWRMYTPLSGLVVADASSTSLRSNESGTSFSTVDLDEFPCPPRPRSST
ncbi:hypothetical protein PLICRDRAFT_172255 [Plicaturopsis crispa FD-325 SS-3]|nr:hypothetical protein PLICRDRAFT_172255 [Plicaturopsis crispa FD-325 SS-3]